MDIIGGPREQDLNDLRWAFEHLRREFIWLQQTYDTYFELYESGQPALDFLDQASSSFFRDHNWMINDYIRLNIWKITDSGNNRKRNENLTVENIDCRLKELGLQTQEIEEVSAEIHRFRKLINSSRSKIIAHADMHTLRQGEAIGELPDGELEAFLRNIQLYSDLVGAACGLGPLDYTGTGRAADVNALLNLLAAGLQNRR